MKHSLLKFFFIVIAMVLASCAHQVPENEPAGTLGTPEIRTTPAEIETNVESPGISPAEAGADKDLRLKF